MHLSRKPDPAPQPPNAPLTPEIQTPDLPKTGTLDNRFPRRSATALTPRTARGREQAADPAF